MKVFVTGATGFIGHNLVHALLQQGNEVTVLARSPEKAEKLFQGQVKIIRGDVTDKKTLAGVCRGQEAVFHLAALMGHDSPDKEAFAKFRSVNVEGTKNMVQQAVLADVPKFIYISSTAALGIVTTHFINDQTPCRPKTPYQVSKYEAEQLVLNAIRENGLNAIIVRPSMVYGPGFKGDFLTIAKVVKTGFFPSIGTGQNLGPALFISDVVDGLVKIMEKGKIGSKYFLTSEKSYPMREKAFIISRALNRKLRFVYVPSRLALSGAGLIESVFALLHKKPPVTKSNILSTITDRTFDVAPLQRDVGFKQHVTIEEGLAKTVNYYLANHLL